MKVSTVNLITLRQKGMRCDIAPALGGSLTGLWWGDVPVLRETPVAQMGSALESACYPLVPYSNLIGDAQLQWAGQQYLLNKNFPPEPHAIHGTGWERAWSVERVDSASVTLTLDHSPSASWPFAFRATQTLRLEDDALHMQISITNTHNALVPAGLGWHPYFAKRSDAHIAFAATGRWEMGPDNLPLGLEAHPGLDQDVAALSVDPCFEGWNGVLEWKDPLLTVQVQSDLRRLVVFTRPELDCIAIEPVSHANNAFKRLADAPAPTDALGVQLLRPQQTFSAHMRIAVQPQPSLLKG